MCSAVPPPTNHVAPFRMLITPFRYEVTASRNTSGEIAADHREQTDDSYSGVVLINNGRNGPSAVVYKNTPYLAGLAASLHSTMYTAALHRVYIVCNGTRCLQMAHGDCQCPLSNSTELLRWRATVTTCGRREAADLMHAIRVQSCFPRNAVAQTAGE
jgi:hypothetical protein